MIIRTCTGLIACILILFLAAAELEGKVSDREAERLKGELTPLGAVRGGNDEGTIPPWTDGIKEPPANYVPGMHHPDPFADDKILFTITSKNVDQYKDKLSSGQIAMFRRYPESWRIEVYPTRRSASYPQRIYDAAIANAVTADLSEDGNGVVNAAESIPFPIPKSGKEVIWNHLLRYRGERVHQVFGQAIPTTNGVYTVVMIDQKLLFPYSMPGATIDTINNRSIYFLQTVTTPPRMAGQLILVHETLNQVKEPRKAWTYNPGQRRVRRAPNIAYDNPGTASDGQRTADQLDMFNGAPDRYDWTLLGKKEIYVPYNCYKLHSGDLRYEEILQPGHLNPELIRYELHRVWVVEARLKKDTRHVYADRVFYLDEDSWAILVADLYDTRGQMWRVSEAYPINFYEKKLVFSTLEVTYDLLNGRYIAVGLDNEGQVEDFGVDLSVADFTPAALRRIGRR